MSYSRLGEIAVTNSGELPPFEQGSYMQQFEHEQDWGRVGDDAVLGGMLAILKRLQAVSPLVTAPRVDGQLKEDAPFMRALRSLWVRMGRAKELWPGARGEFNFGPNTNESKDLRINKVFYALLREPRSMWRKNNEDGYVRLSQGDHLYSDVIYNKLVESKYLDKSQPVSTKDESAMVTALGNWYTEAKAQGANVGYWPSGINFGPNTNGDEIRISDELLTNILTQPSPRQTAARQQVAAALTGMTVRAPVFGSLISAPSPTAKVALSAAALKFRAPSSTLASTLRSALLATTIKK